MKVFLKLSIVFLGRNQPIKYFFVNSALIHTYLVQYWPIKCQKCLKMPLVYYYSTVSELVLATANDEIPDICLSFSPKITRKKIGGMKCLIIKVLNNS